MLLLRVVAEIFDPIAELLLRLLGFDFLRDDVLDVNKFWAINMQLRVIPVIQQFDFFQAIPGAINIGSEIRGRKIFPEPLVGRAGGAVALPCLRDGVLGVDRAKSCE